MPIIVGAPRPGTTLLRFMLDTHPEMAIPPETGFLALFPHFYQLYASRFAKPRWGDKTPSYCHHMQNIEEVLPEAHFIHIIRDGRDETQ